MVNIITVLKPNIRLKKAIGIMDFILIQKVHLKMVSKRDFGNTIIPMERLRPSVHMLMERKIKFG